MTVRVGIEKLRVYPASCSLDIGDLCKARGMDVERTLSDLMVEQRAVNPPWEDAVTLAVNAAHPLLDGRRSAFNRAFAGRYGKQRRPRKTGEFLGSSLPEAARRLSQFGSKARLLSPPRARSSWQKRGSRRRRRMVVRR